MRKARAFFKKEIGIILCLVFFVAFLIIAKLLMPYFYGANWYLVNGVQRLVFGFLELFLFIKIFHKESWNEVFHFKRFKAGFLAGFAMLLIIPFYIVTYYILGAKSWVTPTGSIVFWLLIQQLGSAFWEEMAFRAFAMEGYFAQEHKTRKIRVIYALISFVLFGLAHAVEYNSIWDALYQFGIHGIWGFAFASVYLYSHNILAPMLLHFLTNIFSHVISYVAEWNNNAAFLILDNYGYFIFMGFILITAVIFLLKEPKE